MATLAEPQPALAARGREKFFFYGSMAMVFVMVAGFSIHALLGRSTFSAPPIVHAHALVFFGWVTLFAAQNVLATSGRKTLHMTLGLVAFAWIPLMIAMGFAITIYVVRGGIAPPFFDTREFLIGNPAGLLCFAGLAFTGLAMRKRDSAWHKRLMFCAMASITGPGFGRLLPVPLMIPWSWTVAGLVMPAVFVVAGMIADKRRDGRVHPAFLWGLGIIAATHVGSELIAFSPIGTAITESLVAGTPAEGLSFAPHFPGTPALPR